ncbi:uncharacterized protein TRIVIDRAFT_62734 [Trichoderma virens Gv29-8]|uniref:Uncharacterized protein n=1 Tax=Hypocrea virens (strain Gv29-8 / FGSC 10586) TaxID=413071 RepID=G9MEX0_HYPVG|nr:uncharacterized protein TRIVIDRAFT_62734 [Trichoderma virens Gv29-8]EHK26938.1 hypothetical protein TRIVIDRAFT_62734 [Trichoderma virens Gv29-8]UKZ57389.1 hypothetical protein TrVGV298_011244 [Trichoderma virens]
MSFKNAKNTLGVNEDKGASISSPSKEARSGASVYQTLAPRCIRLLKLLPGSGPDPIKIQLQPVSLENPGPYRALSYVWGDAKVGRRTIHLSDTTLSVTANLFNALCRHRLKLRSILGPLIADMREKYRQGGKAYPLPQRLLKHIPMEVIGEAFKQENDPVWSSTEVGVAKQFIVTENGFFGTGLPGVEVGDVVAILASSGNPWYLRKQGEHYIVIGKGWIHGLMCKDD